MLIVGHDARQIESLKKELSKSFALYARQIVGHGGLGTSSINPWHEIYS